jgi:hypothetical protein
VTATPDPENPRVEAMARAYAADDEWEWDRLSERFQGVLLQRMRVVLAAADAAADTVPVDRETLREVRGYLSWRAASPVRDDLLRRLPDPDADL